MSRRSNLMAAFRADRLKEAESQLTNALKTLDTTVGRASVDNRGIGAVRMLVTKSLESVAIVRAELAKETEAA